MEGEQFSFLPRLMMGLFVEVLDWERQHNERLKLSKGTSKPFLLASSQAVRWTALLLNGLAALMILFMQDW